MIASELGGALFVVPAIVRALANKRSDLYFRYEFCDEDAQYAGELIIEGGYEHGELEILKSAVEDFVELLNSEGRASIITFHSLEDRIVKNVFKEKATDCNCPPKTPICICGHKAEGKLVNKKPIVPTAQEIEKNERSRSAKLRVFEKILMSKVVERS